MDIKSKNKVDRENGMNDCNTLDHIDTSMYLGRKLTIFGKSDGQALMSRIGRKLVDSMIRNEF